VAQSQSSLSKASPSGSSTDKQENSSETSPSTPPAITNAENRKIPWTRGFRVFLCLERSHGGPVVNLHGPRHDWVRRPLLHETSSCAARKILPTLFTARPEPAEHDVTQGQPRGNNITGNRRPRFDPNEFVRSAGTPYTLSKRGPRNRTQRNSDPMRDPPAPSLMLNFTFVRAGTGTRTVRKSVNLITGAAGLRCSLTH
jgi:hypothetical protein